MSQRWSKGPVCGIDNCRSRLYRSLNGQRFCQYGHIRDGDIEINDDDDEGTVTTRRLKIPSQRQVTQSQQPVRHFGVQARVVFFKCYQHLLFKQCELVVQEYRITNKDDLLNLVKYNWIKYLQYQNNQSGDFEYGKIPKLHDGPLIIYFACFRLQIPIYLFDFINLIKDNKIPYMNARLVIPQEWKSTLPGFYMRLLTLVSVPNHGELYRRAGELNKHIYKIDTELNVVPFIVKLLYMMVLPIDVFSTAESLVHESGVDLKWSSMVMTQSPEINVIAVLIAAVKIFFEQNIGIATKSASIIERVPLVDLNEDVQFDELVKWDHDKIDHYLNSISKFILETDGKPVDIAKKRVYDIFPISIKESSNIDYYKQYLNSDNDDFKIDHIYQIFIERLSHITGLKLQQLIDKTERLFQ